MNKAQQRVWQPKQLPCVGAGDPAQRRKEEDRQAPGAQRGQGPALHPQEGHSLFNSSVTLALTCMGFTGGSDGKNLPAMRETRVQSLGWEDLLEEGMATHSSILAWRIPWTEEPGGYSPWGCQESDTTERLHFPAPVRRV